MASPTTKTDICNMALGRIGHELTTAVLIAADTDVDAVKCNLHYEQTRDALLRSHWWRFAGARVRLASAWATATVYTTDQYVSNDDVWYKCLLAHTSGALDDEPGTGAVEATYWTTKTDAEMIPVVEWDLMFDLPSDWLADRYTYDDNDAHRSPYSYKAEGDKYLTRENAVDYVYTKKVETVTSFDPLFIEVFVLSLALKFAMAMGQDKEMYALIKEELYGTPRQKGLMSKVRAMDKQEQNTAGIYDYNTWLAAYKTSREPTHLGGP